MPLVDDAAAAVSAAGVVVGVVGSLATGRLRAALALAVELLTAAGLLKLVGPLRWSSIVVAAALVLLRHGLAARLSADIDRSAR
jgi:hypothetical protein